MAPEGPGLFQSRRLSGISVSRLRLFQSHKNASLRPKLHPIDFQQLRKSNGHLGYRADVSLRQKTHVGTDKSIYIFILMPGLLRLVVSESPIGVHNELNQIC